MKNQTDKVVNWFKGIWERHQYDKGTRDEIRERVQMDINVNHFTEEELDDLGKWVWDDWTDFKEIIAKYPLPNIQTEIVKWYNVGKYLVNTLNLELWEWDEDDDDYDEENEKDYEPPIACNRCSNYYGKVYNSNLLICAIHPHGSDDKSCPDFIK